MKGISIVICTYNGKKTISKALENIANQEINNFSIELIIVDNNSNDGTYDFVIDKCNNLNFSFPYKVLKEPLEGKFNASTKGFSNAVYDYILVCDDDNFLAPDYCKKAYEIFENNDKVGLIGGKGIAVFEETKPDWFNKFETVYACGSQYHKTGIVEDINLNFWGAGLVFRKSIWNRIKELNYDFFLNAVRTNKDKSGGDDSELCELAKWFGYKLYYDDNMTFKHYMPAKRINIDFLKKRYRGFGKSRIYMKAYTYCYEKDDLPDKHLKIPFWKDMLKYSKRELFKFYPRIWFIKETPDNFDYILKFQSLKGEIAEIKTLKNDYINVYIKIFKLKKNIL